MRTLVMGMNIGICREEEKNSKKKILLDYLMRHVKVLTMFYFYFTGFCYNCGTWTIEIVNKYICITVVVLHTALLQLGFF